MKFSDTEIKLKKVLAILLCLIPFSMASNIASAAGNKHNYLGVFTGILDSGGKSENIFGIEYEYKFNAQWGVGAVYEKANDYHDGDGLTSKIAALYYHPDGNWRIGAGFGKEKVGGYHPHTENLTRLGVSYDFHIGDFGIAPSLNFDRVDGHTARVYGVAFLWSF